MTLWTGDSKNTSPEGPCVSLKVALPAEGGQVVLSVRSERWVTMAPAAPTRTGPVVVLGQRGVWHGVPYQEVLIYPLRRGPEGRAELLQDITVEVVCAQIPEVSPRSGTPPAQAPGDFDAFINPSEALAFQSQGLPLRPAEPKAVPEPTGSGDPLRIEVRRDGICRMDYAYLTGHGLDPSLSNVENLHLRCRGIDLPFLLEGPSSGPLTVSHAVVFYGQKLSIRNRPVYLGGDFSDINVYWLYADSTPGLRLGSASADPTHGYAPRASFSCATHVEVNNYNWPVDHYRPNGDSWFWVPLLMASPGATSSKDYTVSLPHPLGTSVSATVVTAGASMGNHTLSVKINGLAPTAPPDPAAFQDKQILTRTWGFSSGLTPGANTVTLTVGGVSNYDYQFLDFFDFLYPRTFEADGELLTFTDANADASYASPGYSSAPYILDLSQSEPTTGLKLPVLLTGAGFTGGTASFEMPENPAVTGRVVALSSAPLLPDAAHLAATPLTLVADNPAAMVIITHPDFHPAGADAVWQAYLSRRSAVMSVMAVDIESIYDTYSYGLFDPAAIRSFLTSAEGVWGRAPRYVLLVGDASYDYKNYTNTAGNKNWVPTMMFDDVGDSTYMGRYPSDAWFADVSGDGYPDSAVGRLPAQTYAELAGMLTKIMAYEDQVLSGSWYKSGLFVADTWTQSWEQIFEEANTLLGTTYTTPPWIANYLFFHNPPYNGTDADGFAAALRGAWPGSALVHYSGHSGISSLGNHYAFFTSYPSRNCASGTCLNSDVDLLPPIDLAPSALSAPLPFVVSSSCYNSAFDELGTPALMKALVARADRGTIGSCGFSTIAYPDQEHTFANAFFNLAFGRSKVRTTGDLVEAGRFALASSDARSVMGNILMGDASLSLRLPAPLPPPSLSATPADGAVTLSWSSPPGTVAHFGLYRSEDGAQTWGSVASPASGDHSFLDGGLVNGTEYIYYMTTWDAEGFEGGPGPLATAVPEPGVCTVTCQAQGPASAVPGSAAAFQATAIQASCSGSLTYDWDFGDGSAHEAALSPAHIYATAGNYSWTFTALADSTSCTKGGTITVAVPPQITDVKRAASPFRIILTGSGIHADVAVYVGGQRWTTFKVVPETKITLKGSTLKTVFPADTFVAIRLANGDGGETAISYNRSTGEWH